MEEKKVESAGEAKCVCQHMAACEGGIHRYCFRRCCMWKSIIAALVLVLVFSAGFGFGHGGHHERFDHHFRGGHMMGMMQERGNWNMNQGRYYQVNQMNPMMIYRTGTVQVAPTSSIQVQVSAPMMTR